MASNEGIKERIVYRCVTHKTMDLTHHCCRCKHDLCITCLLTGNHSEHDNEVLSLSEFLHCQRREAEMYIEEIEKVTINAGKTGEHLGQIIATAKESRNDKERQLDDYMSKVEVLFKEEIDRTREYLLKQKEDCIKSIGDAKCKVEKEIMKAPKEKSNAQLHASLQRILKKCSDTRDVSSVKVKKCAIKDTFSKRLPEVWEKDDHIYERTSFIQPLTNSLPPPPDPPTSRRPTLYIEATSELVAQSLLPTTSQLSPTTIIPSTQSIIATILQNQGNSVHLSSVCSSTEKDDIMIADYRNGSIHKFNQQLEFKSTISCKRNQPLFLAEGSDGKVYRLEKSPKHGYYIHSCSSGITDNVYQLLPLTAPKGFAVRKNKGEKMQVFVTNSSQEVGQSENKIIIFFKGQQCKEITERHSLLKEPFGIAYGEEGTTSYLIVTDMEQGCMIKMTLTGSHLWNEGVSARRPRVLNKPYGVAILPRTGHIAVTEQQSHQIALFSAEGELCKRIGREGNQNGTFRRPQAISATSAGDLLVLDSGNERVQIIPYDSLGLS